MANKWPNFAGGMTLAQPIPGAPKRGSLITFRNDRLGGRLISLVNMLRLAQTYDLPFQVRWHASDDIAKIFNDPAEFFDPNFVAQHFITAGAWHALRGDVIRPSTLGTPDIATLRSLIDQGRHILIDPSFGHLVLGGENAQTVARQTAETWAHFPLSTALRDEAARITAQMGPNATGYHIRRGDIITTPRVMNKPWPHKYIYDEVYEAHITHSLAQGTTPILFSDDADTLSRFTNRFPGLRAAQTLLRKSACTPGQNDLLELLTMAACAKIIAPNASGFSSTAATLGGVQHIDILADLSPAQATAAAEALVARTRHIPSTPPKLREKGHLSQSLGHMVPYLRGLGRHREAAEILQSHIDAGLNISHLYPQLAEAWLTLGDIDRTRALGTTVHRREVHYLVDLATTTALCGLADRAAGDTAQMANRMLTAYWNAPQSPLICGLVGALLQSGTLTAHTFLPTTPAAMTTLIRPSMRLMQSPALANNLDLDPTAPLVPATDPLLWDWAPLMRPAPKDWLRKHRLRAHYERGLARRRRQINDADAQSLQALFDMHLGDQDGWFARLNTLAKANPDHAMVQHRASLAAFTNGRIPLALDRATAAISADAAAPAHRIWRGILRAKANDHTGAFYDLNWAADAGFTLPRLHLRLAAAAAKTGNVPAQLRAMDSAIRIAPRDAVSRLTRAEYHDRRGDHDRALADLAIVMRFDQVPPRAQAMWDRCQAAALHSSRSA